MHAIRRQRLLIVLAIVVVSSVAVALVAFALRENMNLFFPPIDYVEGRVPQNQVVRLGGFVDRGSLQRDSGSLAVRFTVGDGENRVPVLYEGILPDLFEEGQAAIAKGQWDGSLFRASEVLAKHDETYTPPEIIDSMKKMNGPKPAAHPGSANRAETAGYSNTTLQAEAP